MFGGLCADPGEGERFKRVYVLRERPKLPCSRAIGLFSALCLEKNNNQIQQA